MNQDRSAALFAAELGAAPELDVHGLSVHAAIKELEDFIGRESGRKTPAVRIICGHGTGTLFAGLRQFLSKKHPLIADWRVATVSAASTGAIMVVALY
jgi:DNA-nicking Smr family endonuclease